MVHAYCKNKNEHEDLVQEIILQLWSSFKMYDEKYQHSTWIYRISINTAISFYRKSHSKKISISTITPKLESTLQSAEVYSEDPMILLLNECILQLREIDRALILLHLEGLSYQQIGEVIGITPTNVSTKLFRIKKILKDQFRDKLKKYENE